MPPRPAPAALICLSRDSRADVKAFVAALTHGGSDNGKMRPLRVRP